MKIIDPQNAELFTEEYLKPCMDEVGDFNIIYIQLIVIHILCMLVCLYNEINDAEVTPIGKWMNIF